MTAAFPGVLDDAGGVSRPALGKAVIGNEVRCSSLKWSSHSLASFTRTLLVSSWRKFHPPLSMHVMFHIYLNPVTQLSGRKPFHIPPSADACPSASSAPRPLPRREWASVNA